ncbi:hypothetical protein AZ46_0218435 [Metabacillus indicus LMG 22858]|nr:hypothetical protein AZ46_0218435 [Metabacillus indicus LMG 22858]
MPLFLEKADPLLAVNSNLLENFQLTPKLSVQTTYLIPGSKTLLGILIFKIGSRPTLRPLLATQRGILA